jgi:hypothetical protein
MVELRKDYGWMEKIGLIVFENNNRTELVSVTSTI